jgi:hypothetical protein
LSKVDFNGSQAGVEQLPLRDDDNVHPWSELVATKNLSNQTFSSISNDGAADFFRRRYAQPADDHVVGEREQGEQPAMHPAASIVDPLVFDATTDPLVPAEPDHLYWSYWLLTLSRLRPFARRRFSTSRPFLVAMRTRNPCVRARRRVLG